MQIPIRCETCEHEFEVDSYYRGLIVSCPECEALVNVPANQSPTRPLGSPKSSSRTRDDASEKPKSLEDRSSSQFPTSNDNANANPWDNLDPTLESSKLDQHENRPQQDSPFDVTSEDLPEARFLVKTAQGDVYGPVNAETVLRWGTEGRLDGSCHVKQEDLDFWVSYPSWKNSLQAASNRSKFEGTSDGKRSSRDLSLPDNEWGTRHYQEQVHRKASLKTYNGVGAFLVALLSWILCPTLVLSLALAVGAFQYSRDRLALPIDRTIYKEDLGEFGRQKSFLIMALLFSLVNCVLHLILIFLFGVSLIF